MKIDKCDRCINVYGECGLEPYFSTCKGFQTSPFIHRFFILFYDIDNTAITLELHMINTRKETTKDEVLHEIEMVADSRLPTLDANYYSIWIAKDESSLVPAIIAQYLHSGGYIYSFPTALEVAIEFLSGCITEPTNYICERYGFTEEMTEEVLDELETFTEWKD